MRRLIWLEEEILKKSTEDAGGKGNMYCMNCMYTYIYICIHIYIYVEVLFVEIDAIFFDSSLESSDLKSNCGPTQSRTI